MPDARDHVYGATSFRVVVSSAKAKQELGLCAVSAIGSLQAPATPDGARRHDTLATVTLRRALTGGTELFDWRRDATAQGEKAKRTVVIDLLALPGGQPVATWRLDGALPVRWTGPELDGLSHGLALEELELAVDAVTWLVPGQQPDPRSPHTIPFPAGPAPAIDPVAPGALGVTPVKPARPTG